MMAEEKPQPAVRVGAEEEDAGVGERLRRLQQLGVQRGRAGLGAPRPAAAPRPTAAGEAETTGQPIEQLVGGQLVFTPHGPCLLVERRYSLAETRGGWSLAAVLGLASQAVAACARNGQLADFNLRRAAFLDTETTGLAGGAGTLAFMVGIGLFEAGQGAGDLAQGLGFEAGQAEAAGADGMAYVVRQVFMRHPGEERALLHVVSNLLARCNGLVSFNGRAFDAPLLAARFVMHHAPSPLADLQHLDLLPLARQRWRLRLESCALGALERDVLDFQRSQEDVPGWLIPSLYQDYAATGDGSSLARVFYHNQEDVTSMAPLLAILCAPFQDAGRSLAQHVSHPVDYVSLARCYEDLGWLETSEQAYRQALDRPLPPHVRSQALQRLGWLLKRQERRSEAAAVWHDWITSVPGPDPTPYAELAKHHEWHDLDLEAARKWALWGLHTARQMPPGPAREQAVAELQHRLERLERKLEAEGS